MKDLYPIILKNRKLKPFQISSNIEIKRLTKEERIEFFGLKKVEFSWSKNKAFGHIGMSRFFPSEKRGRLPYMSLTQRGFHDNSSDILAANYVVLFYTDQSPDFLVEQLNLSFNLFQPTSSGCYIGFTENKTDVHYHNNMRIAGPYDYLHLKGKDLVKIKELFTKIRHHDNDNRFKLLSQLYMRSLEGGKMWVDLRFLLLVITLENLYLPNKDHELSFRLRIKVAKVLSNYKFGKPKDIYRIIKDIYDARSELIHNGKTSKLTWKLFIQLTNIVRISLMIYLTNKRLFDDSCPIEEIVL